MNVGSYQSREGEPVRPYRRRGAGLSRQEIGASAWISRIASDPVAGIINDKEPPNTIWQSGDESRPHLHPRAHRPQGRGGADRDTTSNRDLSTCTRFAYVTNSGDNSVPSYTSEPGIEWLKYTRTTTTGTNTYSFSVDPRGSTLTWRTATTGQSRTTPSVPAATSRLLFRREPIISPVCPARSSPGQHRNTL